MKYGACQWTLPGQGLKVLEIAGQLGLDGIEAEYSREAVKSAKDYAHLARELGLELPTIGMNIFCEKSYIEKGAEQMFRDEISRAIEMACTIGSKILQIPAFVASKVKTDTEFSYMAENLAAACELAAKENLLVGTENVLSLVLNQELFRRVHMDNFRFYFDTQNMCQMEGKPTDDVLRGMKDVLCEVHVKDSSCRNGSWTWTALGQGDTDFNGTIQILKEIGYDGWIHLETDYHENQPETLQQVTENAIRRDIEYVRKRMA